MYSNYSRLLRSWFRPSPCSGCIVYYIVNRPGVAGAVLQTALSFIDSFIHSFSEPFPPDIHNIINPKPLELDS